MRLCAPMPWFGATASGRAVRRRASSPGGCTSFVSGDVGVGVGAGVGAVGPGRGWCEDGDNVPPAGWPFSRLQFQPRVLVSICLWV